MLQYEVPFGFHQVMAQNWTNSITSRFNYSVDSNAYCTREQFHSDFLSSSTVVGCFFFLGFLQQFSTIGGNLTCYVFVRFQSDCFRRRFNPFIVMHVCVPKFYVRGRFFYFYFIVPLESLCTLLKLGYGNCGNSM